MSIKQLGKSLSSRGNQLADTFYQLQVLNGRAETDVRFPAFSQKIKEAGFEKIKPTGIEIFQLNIGKLCNQTCAHCHVDAGPDKKAENMNRETLEICLDILRKHDIPKVDITGGAPEMNPHFRWFVEECHKLGKHVMNRCNLTIIRANPKYYDLPEFFAKNEVEIISSLPHYSQTRTDSQRGDGVFEDSIKALQMLNEVGYGMPDSKLALNLVYNPTGTFLPGDQMSLEADFKRQLKRKFNIDFHNLYAITNMPISRFLDYLLENNHYVDYMQSLLDAFNPSAVAGVMCRNTVSISWEGHIYDCDFNQMLDLKVIGQNSHISKFNFEELMNRNIILNQHCYGCTAGSGSSCGGTVA